jgi:hypothetical protein
MPTYYFHLRDKETIADAFGTDLADVTAARAHAVGVARELMFNSRGILQRRWADWTMLVTDDTGTELFSFTLSDFGEQDSTGRKVAR